jgi:hypothetical protein
MFITSLTAAKGDESTLGGKALPAGNVYALFINFLPVPYEFSNEMEFDHDKESGRVVICPLRRVERPASK